VRQHFHNVERKKTYQPRKTDPKDKHIHKNKHYHMETQMQNMFVIVELLYLTGKRGKGK
jgi:hypothetical protein